MYCRKCGKEIDASVMICPECGAPQSDNISYCSHCGKPIYSGAAVCTSCGAATANRLIGKSKLVAGLLGIFLGSFGIHNFYLGYQTKGLTQLLVSLVGGIITCGISTVAMEIWGLIEGIQILTGSINQDADGNPLAE